MSSVTREQIIGLLKVAACPASCDNGVVVRDQLHGEIEQCQFCFEREKAIADLQAVEPAAWQSQQAQGGPVVIDEPEFKHISMGCGLEDRGITCRYEAMEYGFHEAIEQYGAIIESYSPLYTAPVEQQPDVSELVKAAQTLWRESYSCESDFIQAVVDAFSKQEEEEPVVQQHYSCGCVTCICEDDVQCQGCGGTSCDDFKGPSCGCTHLKEEAER